MSNTPPSLCLNATLPDSPLATCSQWLEHAWKHAGVPNPNAMTLSTVRLQDGEPYPSSRIILLKGFDAEAGYAVFYSNYQSRKGAELEHNTRACAVLHWDKLGLQVRFEGAVIQSPLEESDAYFNSRPRESRLGAWTSAQSQTLTTRQVLLDQRTAVQQRFQAHGENIPRPPHWGGYRLWLDAVELWCNGDYRLHDRALWTRKLSLSDNNLEQPNAADTWSVTRLQP